MGLACRKRVFVILGVFFIMQFSGCSQNIQRTQNISLEFDYPDFMWENTNLKYASFKNSGEFEEEMRCCINKIIEITGLTEWYKKYNEKAEYCRFQTTITDVSYLGEGGEITKPTYDSEKGMYTTIKLDSSYIGAGLNIIGHELTHLIVGAGFSASLNEGLSEYCQRNISGTNSSVSRAGINDFLKNYYEVIVSGNEENFNQMKADIIESIGKAGGVYSYGTSGTGGGLWYHYSESFVTYLIDTYGAKETALFISEGSGEEDYGRLDSRGFEAIKSDWLKFYESYIPAVGYEEISREYQEFAEKYAEIRAENVK